MKKLMIAAAAAAMVGGVYAGCEKPTKTVVNCAEVYDVVFNLKTTKCNCEYVAGTTGATIGCIKAEDTPASCKAWRTVVTKKVYGVIWSCECTCSENLTEESPLLVAPAQWDGTLAAADAQGNQYFWMPSEKLVLDSLMTFKFLARIGAANGKVEAYGTFGDGIYFAGFGTHGALRTKTISGGVAGCWGAPWDCSTEDQGVFAEDCPAYGLCDAKTAVADYTTTAVYGSFTVKYNNAKSVKLAKGGSLVDIGVIPTQYKKLKAIGVKVAAYESRAM